MGRPRSHSVTIRHEPGRAKPWRARWMEGGRKCAQSFVTEQELLDFKARVESKFVVVPAAIEVKPSAPQRPAPNSARDGLGLMVTAPKGSLTLTQVAKEWLDSYLTRRKAGTWVHYEKTLRVHVLPVIGTVRVKHGVLSTAVVMGLMDNRQKAGVKWPTQTAIIRVLSSLCGWAVFYEHLLANPCAKLLLRLRDDSTGDYDEPEPNPLNEAQLNAFLEWVQTGRVPSWVDRPVDVERKRRWRPAWARLYPTYLLLARTGVRRGEAAAVKWTNVYLDRKPIAEIELKKTYSPSEYRLNRTKGSNGENKLKGNQPRTVLVAPDLEDALRELARTRRERAFRERRDPLPYVCETVRGYRMRASDQVLDKVLSCGLSAIGLVAEDYTMHCLRDTFATMHLLDDPSSLAWVSLQLGHKNTTITLNRYTKFVDTNGLRGQAYATKFARRRLMGEQLDEAKRQK